jgi:dihydroxy-acid dehydratase
MPCEGCTCGRGDTASAAGRVESGGLAGAEQLLEQEQTQQGQDQYALRGSRSFTAPSEWVEPAEGVEPAVPLRSKKWFNEPGDDMVGCYVERYLNGGLTCEPHKQSIKLTR